MTKSFDNLLVSHCAPTLARIKAASLFCYHPQMGEPVCQILDLWRCKFKPFGVELATMERPARCGVLIYVYRPDALSKKLDDPEIQRFLSGIGYQDCSCLQRCLSQLTRRMAENDTFPHEIGIFLDYPLQDVIGFMKNKGKAQCACGCWKVYGDQVAAEKRFRQYAACKRIYQQLHRCGHSVLQLTIPA